MEQIIEKYITKIYVSGRSFYIVFSQDYHYLAIEDKYIDGDGRLAQKLNGIQMHSSRSYAECVEQTIKACEVDKLVAKGVDVVTACIMVHCQVDFETASARVKAVKKREH
ncbi:MAG: hypothetical protein LUG23_00265 [Oscillospiraceae bacterium]|nr:hypothetical protein [Oscillospiraceae bacterium]